MSKFRVIMNYPDGSSEVEEELFDTEEEAEECGLYNCSCYSLGGEILHMSNPGDHPYDEDDRADFEIEEIDD